MDVLTAAERDDALVARACGGDGAAFAALVARHAGGIYARAYRLLGHPVEAEEATQETFVRAYVQLASYQAGTSFRAWLLAIATHWCIDCHRIRARQARHVAALGERQARQEADEASGRPEAAALRRERERLVRTWVTALPALPQVVALRYYDELSYAEIGAALGQPATAVRMRLHRARRLLRAAGHPEQP